jgi:predicted amidophosphoribosyltransferase
LQVSAGPDLRKRARRNQSGRTYADRFYAVHDSLAFVGPARHRRWLLLEDVFTTGATANEAARILKKNGALSVFVLSLLLRPGTVR